MALTAVEKIISRHAGRVVRAGDLTVAAVDAVMAHDGNAPLAIRILHEELGSRQVFDPARVLLVIDHCGPSANEGAANMQRIMRAFVAETGARLYDAGEGICHLLLPEQGHAWPGGLIVGSDSHSVTYGAINCLGTGMGSTDIAVAMYTGKVWLRVPEVLRIRLAGRLTSGVSAKDLTLHLLRLLGADGATYKCLEIDGDGLASLPMDYRFTVCNMAVEMGAKCALMPVDDVCRHYLDGRLAQPPEPVWSDPGCSYEAEYTVELSQVEPLVALPHDLSRIVPARQVGSQPVDMAFIGTCTNSRLTDLREAAEVLRGRRVNPRVRLIVTPGTRGIYLEALRQGLVEVFVAAGGVVTPPGCGPCLGTHLGVPGDGEVVVSTANRNYRGRMGNRNASIILASPTTVAASALLGRVATPAEVC